MNDDARRTRSILTSMRRVVAWMWVAVLACTWCALPAGAQQDAVRELDISLHITKDGTVKIQHTYDWEFTADAPRQIHLGIPLRRHIPDTQQVAVYTVENLGVSSPSGANLEFDVSETGDHPALKELTLRSDDPATRQRFVINYDLHGALDTHEGKPRFSLWPVLAGTPTVDALRMTVTTEAGRPPEAWCGQDVESCEILASDTQIKFQANQAQPGANIGFGIELPKAQRGVETTFEEPQPALPVPLYSDLSVTVNPDGSADLQQEVTYWAVGDETGTEYIFRNTAQDGYYDRTFEIDNFDAGVNGQVPERVVFEGKVPEGYLHKAKVDFIGSGYGVVSVKSSWRVANLAHSEGALAQASWVASNASEFPAAGVVRFELPDVAHDAWCVGRGCDSVTSAIDGNRVTFRWSRDPDVDETMDLAVTLPAAAVGYAKAERDLSSRVWDSTEAALAGALITAIAGFGLFHLGKRLGRIRIAAPSQYYRDAAPGERGSETADGVRGDEIPVRTSPPEVPIQRAGVAWFGGFNGAQTAAVVTEMATRDALRISAPLALTPGEEGRAKAGLQMASYEVVANHPGAMGRAMRSGLNNEVRSRVESHQDLFRGKTNRATWTYRTVLALVLPVAALVAGGLQAPTVISLSLMILAVVFLVGLLIGFATAPRPLTATGTQLREQVAGFRRYLATVEPEQMKDRESFQRYLPWAVLLGLTDRWVEVAGSQAQLPQAGLDVSDSSELTSTLNQLTRTLRSARDLVPRSKDDPFDDSSYSQMIDLSKVIDRV